MARSKPGFAFSSMCQLPVMRFTFKTGSDGSLKFARPRSTELVPEPSVYAGSDGGESTEPEAIGALVSLHAVKAVTQTSAATMVARVVVIAAGKWLRRCMRLSVIRWMVCLSPAMLQLSTHHGLSS